MLILSRAMAQDEMETITEDKWDEEVWGVEHAAPDIAIPKLILYFGQNVRPPLPAVLLPLLNRALLSTTLVDKP